MTASTEGTTFPGMADSHRHHDHAQDGTGNERRAALAFALTAGFMVVEAVGGLLSGSLALVADAAHMLTDSAALAMTWLAFRLGRLPPDARRSYGYRRAEVLAAFVNGLFVLALAAWIAWEAVARLSEPQPVAGPLMLAVAVGGVAVNLVVLRILGGHGHEGQGHGNLNLRGALLHVMGDLFGSLAAVVAAGVIMVWGWTAVDPLLSLGVAALIVFAAWKLLAQAAHILLEGTPEGFDAAGLCAHLEATVPGLAKVHHVHAWSLTSGRTMLTLHATLSTDRGHDAALAAIKRELETRFGIDHSVVQVEGASCPDAACR